MAVTHVGSNVVDRGSFTNTDFTFTVTSPGVAVGELAVLSVGTDGNPLSTPTDSKGNTWHIARQSNDGTATAMIAYSVVTSALLAGDTINVPATNNRRWYWCLDKITNPAASPFDGTNSATGLQGAGAPTLSLTSSHSPDTAFSVLTVQTTSGSYNGQSGWTATGSGNASATFSAGTDFKANVGSPLTVAPSWSLDRNWNLVAASFTTVESVFAGPSVTLAPSSRRGATSRLSRPQPQPVARVSQAPVEVLYSRTANARLSQEPIEVLYQRPNVPLGPFMWLAYSRRGVPKSRLGPPLRPTRAMLSQEAVEVATQATATARLSQEAVEVGAAGTAAARLSQEAVEVAVASTGTTSAGLSQLAVEVAVQFTPEIDLAFIPSGTVVFPLTVEGAIFLGFIPSNTVVFPLQIGIHLGFFDNTVVFPLFSVFADIVGTGPGDGGESFCIDLAPNGTTVVATLAANLGLSDTSMTLTGDGGFSTGGLVLLIDGEYLYAQQISPGSYRIYARGMSNTIAATHTAGTNVYWTDSYEMAILATANIDASFTAAISGTDLTTYPGWLICFDSTQAYLSGSRYPMHVTEVVGVFAAGTGDTGTNKLDASQPNAIATPTGISDDCPAALSNPARIQTGILTGDVALVRYTNSEALTLTLCARSAALQSWFGLKRVDATDHDVTFTDPNGYVVDSIPPATFTGTINATFTEPLPLSTGIAPNATNTACVPTAHPVPFVTATLPGINRFFTFGPPHYSEKGWPMACLAVRQGQRRVPFWISCDWHNFNFVYAGFFPDATYCQMLVNRNGLAGFGADPIVDLPGPQDINGPNAVWDDATYYYATSWYVVLFNTPYLVVGPSIGGGGPGGDVSGSFTPTPGVTFPSPGSPNVTVPPTIEGGSGGNIPTPSSQRAERFDAWIT